MPELQEKEAHLHNLPILPVIAMLLTLYGLIRMLSPFPQVERRERADVPLTFMVYAAIKESRVIMNTTVALIVFIVVIIVLSGDRQEGAADIGLLTLIGYWAVMVHFYCRRNFNEGYRESIHGQVHGITWARRQSGALLLGWGVLILTCTMIPASKYMIMMRTPALHAALLAAICLVLTVNHFLTERHLMRYMERGEPADSMSAK